MSFLVGPDEETVAPHVRTNNLVAVASAPAPDPMPSPQTISYIFFEYSWLHARTHLCDESVKWKRDIATYKLYTLISKQTTAKAHKEGLIPITLLKSSSRDHLIYL